MVEVALNLFPAPRSATVGRGHVDLSGAAWIVLPGQSSDALRHRTLDAAARLDKVLNQAVRVSTSSPGEGGVLLAMQVDPSLPGQHFHLALQQDRRVLRAGNESGMFYGLLAFVQLVEQFGVQPPALMLEDAPDFPVRGVMLDVSRCKVPTMATLCQLIDQLAGLRLNQMQLYIEHTFAFSAHETVWHDASPFTHEDILELDQYCRDRFMELVPNLNSFGHFERWLRHPEYRHLAECPDGFDLAWGGRRPWGSTLAPTEESLKFVESLYDEYLPLFSSGMLNVGCDETWELGKGRSQKEAESKGTTVVYLDFLKQIHAACVKRGRRMQFWGDIILHQPELIQALPKDCIALNWGYEAGHPFDQQAAAFAEAGIEFYVCPGTSAWNSITGRTDNCLANLENAAKHGLQHGASGYLNTDWGDGGHHQVLPISYAGYAAGAGLSWCLASNRDVDWAAVISRHFLADASGVTGSVLLELGRVASQMPRYQHGNAAIWNQLLFQPLTPEGIASDKYTVAELRAAEARLDALAAMLRQARPQGADRELVLNELVHTIAMARHALHRGCHVLGEGEQTAALRHDLQHLVRSYEEQWLARNRPGGLRESSGRLRDAGESLAD